MIRTIVTALDLFSLWLQFKLADPNFRSLLVGVSLGAWLGISILEASVVLFFAVVKMFLLVFATCLMAKIGLDWLETLGWLRV